MGRMSSSTRVRSLEHRFAIAQHAMQLALHARRHLGEVLQEQRAAGGFDQPRPAADALHRAPLFVAVGRGAATRCRTARARDPVAWRWRSRRHERRVRPAAVAVNRARQHLAPVPRSPYSRIGQRLGATRGSTSMIFRIAGEHAEDAVRRDLRRDPAAPVRSARPIRSCAFEITALEIPRHERRRQDVEHARAEGLERALLAIWIDDADEHRLRPLGADAARDTQRLAAPRAVEQTQHRRALAQLVQRLACAGHPARRQPERRPALRRCASVRRWTC